MPRFAKQADLLFFLLISYVAAAGGWWSYLLYVKNNDALEAKKSVLWYELKEKGASEAEYLASAQYRDLIERYERQQYMILGEGSVLCLLILVGIGQIYRARQRELQLANQQQNFLLSITHELKSPIASVQLSLETLQRRQLTAEQTQRLAQNALRENQRLHTLVQDLLLAARVEGGYQYSFERLDLRELVAHCIEIEAPLYNGEIALECELAAPAWVDADRSTLTSAVLNLLDNAIKYAPRTEKIEVRLSAKSPHFLLEIADQGVGIPRALRGKVFEKFFRIGEEQTRQTKGTGLGLFIVKKVLEAHRGEVFLRDNPPQGTVAALVLPMA